MKIFSLIAVTVLIAGTALAQTYTKTGIRNVRLRGSGEIIHKNQVVGYYLFYNLEKTNNRQNNYQLTVLDENLREINSVTIERSRTYTILEASYNGNTFAVLGFDRSNNMVEIIAYDDQLKQTGTMARLAKGTNMLNAYGAAASGNETEQRFLVPVTDKGFLLYSVNEDRKAHYRVEFLTSELKTLWTDQAPADGNIEMAFEAFQDSETIGSLIEKRKKNTSKDIEYELLVNNTTTGQRIFKVPVAAKNFNVIVSDIRHDSTTGDFIMFGEYYPVGATEATDKSLGFMSIVYDKEGKLLTQQNTSWEDMSKLTPLNEKGKFEGNNTNILFHNTVRTSDGQIFVVGEQYKKAANAAGIALNVAALALGGGQMGSMTQINIYNLVIFQFNPDFTINKVHTFEKNKSVMQMPAGSAGVSPKLVSNYAKAIGAFDYRFTQMSEDNSTFIVNYVDFDRQSEAGRAFVIGSIVYTPEKTFVTDKFNLKKSSTEFTVFKAKPGYILVSEYFRKDKKLESRLEKVNY